jgi:HK97 gp10 family phage protein
VSVFGLSGVLAGFSAKVAEIEAAEREGTEAGANVIAEAWRAGIQSEGLVDTGRYLDSVTVNRDGDHVTVSSDVPYGPILEFGDSRQAAHPVAHQASEERASEVFDVIGEHVTRAIR